ncbi:MAG: glycosyl hydrolase 53 family protein [Saprospiraceae bacterium]
MLRYTYLAVLFAAFFAAAPLQAQPFYLGADLSYVNEMEDCGVDYKEDGVSKDPYAIFADAGANLVRLRLWHTPAWQDTLNDGNRYSDLADVRKSITRAKEAGMAVLLDFHLSDFWADPGRQVVPAAWEGVVDDTPALGDSVYNHVRNTLLDLAADGLLPAMVQIGNETNRGILQTQAANDAGWVLDWPRNAALFNRGIAAVRDVEAQTGSDIQVALHIAGPEDADWLMEGFAQNGVTDYDVIGLSYYWAWHMPTTIGRTGEIVEELRAAYPGKEVMIFETGYIWTTDFNDDAANIISAVQPGYAPASPENQLNWLTDLTQEVINSGGRGVVYWEPAWVSSPCYTPWGQGSHQEHAAFFDFDSNVLPTGGMGFYGFPYAGLVGTSEAVQPTAFRLYPRPADSVLVLEWGTAPPTDQLRLRLLTTDGRAVQDHLFEPTGGAVRTEVAVRPLPRGAYVVEVRNGKKLLGSSVIAW